MLNYFESRVLDQRRQGTGWERTPWQATQRAAWEALMRVERMGGDR